jgi:iron complex transport system substrate-binding protein
VPASVAIRMSSTASVGALVLGCVALAASPPCASADSLPSVASINLCADQLVLAIAAPEQIATVSWLAADPDESLLAAEAARHPLNYGSAEELLRFDPDVVIAGAYTSSFTRALLGRLGYPIVDLDPETSVAEIESNVRRVAQAIGRIERGEALVQLMRARVEHFAATQPQESVRAVVIEPGSFTVGEHSLANELLSLAGVRNVAAEQGLDRWGSLAMETLLRSSPDLIVLTGYRTAQPSLANAVLEHPALRRVRAAKRTATVSGSYWSCGLPQSLDAVELLQRAAAQ